nr:MAG TPA: hypothetical protein [Caudoviricetes sp.]
MKVEFPFEVKYQGKYYTANCPFEAEKKDLQELISIGGNVIEKEFAGDITKCKKSKSRVAAN